MLTLLDWIIIGVYLVLMVAVGIASRGRQNSINDYFVSKGTLPGWVGSLLVGLSIAATYFSGISFLAYPSLIYSYGLVILISIPIFFVIWLVLRYIFLPRFMKTSWSQPYEILEKRFGLGARRLAAGLYIAVRVSWMATLIYAPTIALMAAVRLDESWFWPLVLTIGLSCTIYTAFGGIRGVIVTDAIQMIIIILGVAVTLIYVAVQIPVSFSEAWQYLESSGRLRLWNPELSFIKPMTSVALVLGITAASFGSYIGDQMSLQRYMTSSTVKEVNRSFFINVLSAIIIIILLAGIGLAQAAWYQHRAAELPKSPDLILPYFIASELPSGIAGLILAALLAATMSSMASGINALASSIHSDFRSSTKDSGRHSVWKARLSSTIIGVVATLAAGLVSNLGQLFDIMQRLMGLFLAPLGICLLLSVLPLTIRKSFVVTGLICGCAAGSFVAVLPNLAEFWPFLPKVASLYVGPTSGAITLLISLAGVRRVKPVELRETFQVEADSAKLQ